MEGIRIDEWGNEAGKGREGAQVGCTGGQAPLRAPGLPDLPGPQTLVQGFFLQARTPSL